MEGGSATGKGVKVYNVKPLMTDDEIQAKEGTYFNEKDVKLLIDHDADVFAETSDGKKELIVRFRKNVFSEDMTKLAWDAFHKTAAASRNRGAAAGPINLNSAYWKKRKPTEIKGWSTRYIQKGKKSAMRVNNNVFSSVLGYFERTPFMKLPCRLTSYTQTYFKYYKQGIPFIQAINDQFKKLVPDRYKAQEKVAKSTPAYIIPGTIFSSLTVNRNFRTALHKDGGDLPQGFGNLSVVEQGKYHGGYTVFPQFGVGVNCRTGDFLAMDVHRWHTNTEIYETPEDKKFNATLPKTFGHNLETGTMGSDKKYSRISFVCYYREKLQACDKKESEAYYKRIGFDTNQGWIKKGPRETRKQKKQTKDLFTE
jgi:hypothetical protein